MAAPLKVAFTDPTGEREANVGWGDCPLCYAELLKTEEGRELLARMAELAGGLSSEAGAGA